MNNLFNEFLARPNFWNVAAACIAASTLLWAAVTFLSARWRAARSDYAIALMNKSDVEEIARIVSRKSAAENFRSGLVSLDGSMQRLCGRPWSWRLFNTCLLWAFVFPICVFALAWLAGASGRFAQVEVLPDLPNLSDRTTRLGGAIAFTCSLLLFGAKFESILRALTRMAGDVSGAAGRSGATMDRRQSSPMIRRKAGSLTVIVSAFVALLFALTFVVGVASAIYLATTKALATAFVLGFAVALAFAFGGAFVAAFCATAVGALYFAFVGAAGVAGVQPAVLLAFFLALPLAFSIALYCVWSATHALIEWLARQDGGWRAGPVVLFAGAVACLAVALIGAFLLAGMLGLTLEGANVLMRARELPALDWRADLELSMSLSLFNAPAWLPAGMLASVLAPAGLFFVCGLSAVLLAASPDRRKAETVLRANERLSPEQRGVAAIHLARLELLRAPARVFMCSLVLWAGVALARAADISKLSNFAQVSGDTLAR